MSQFVPKKEYLRRILLHYFIQKTSAAEAHRILFETYGDHALSETTCRDWFRRFKNNDFDVEDKERCGAPKKFKDEELEALLRANSYQTLAEIAELLEVDHTTVSKRLKALGMIRKQGHWVPCELKPRDVERRLFAFESLLNFDTMEEEGTSPSAVAATSETAITASYSPKKAAAATSIAPCAKPAHSKTDEMVNAAIGALNERGGSSLQAIKKYIAATYKVDVEKQATFIKKYLRSADTSGSLIQTKGKGAADSFVLSNVNEAKLAAKPKVPKKPKQAVKKPATPVKTVAASGKKATTKKTVAATVSQRKKVSTGPAAKPPKPKTNKAKPTPKSPTKMSKPTTTKKTKARVAKPKKVAPKEAVTVKK